MRLLVSARIAPCSQTDTLKFRHGLEVVERTGVWRESFSPDCWLAAGKGAAVSIGHDTDEIGQVVVVAARDNWHYADLVIEDPDPETRRLIRVGQPVSIGARSVRCDEDLDLRVRRYTMAQLEHIAIASPHEVGMFPGAKITSVREAAITKPKTGTITTNPKPKLAAVSGVNWRTVLPASHADFADLSDEDILVRRLTLTNGHGSIRWDGTKFAAVGGRRIAA